MLISKGNIMKLVVDKFKVKEIMAKKKINSFKELAFSLDISPNQLANIYYLKNILQ